MSSKKNDAFQEAVVGLFMVVVLGLLVYFTIVISGVDVLQGRAKAEVRVTFDAVGGLKSHDSVMYRGTKVGAVEDIEISPSNLVVLIEVDRSVVLREGYRIAVRNLSMLGGNFMLLEEGEGAVIDFAAAELRGETPTDWMHDVGDIARNLRELTSRGELRTMITNLNEVSLSARNIAQRLERGEGTMGKLLSSDDTVYNDLKATVANASEISKKLNDGDLVEEAKKSLAAFKEACDSIKLGEGFDDEVKKLTQKADTLMSNLNEVALRLKNGEGTLGKLVNDPALYDNVDALSRDVQGLTKDARQVLDNYRDTTPISTFGSLIMGGL